MSLESPAQSQPQSQHKGTKRKNRSQHDAELLPLLQGPSLQVVVGTGVDTASWNIPVALLTKHSKHFHDMLRGSILQDWQAGNNLMLTERSPSIFQVYVQWMYFDTIPSRDNLSRTSTGKSISDTFQLWTLGDYLRADEFKNRIMCKLHRTYSLQLWDEGVDFMELSPAEVDYCWSQTKAGSKLRKFMLHVLAHHTTFGDYIHIKEGNEWYKLFTKHTDLQMQVLARIADSNNTFTMDVAIIPAVACYLEPIME